MKFNWSLLVILLLFCTSSFAQDSVEINRLRHQIALQNLVIKSKSIADPELKALLAKQALTFAKRYHLTDELWGELQLLTYYGWQGLNRSLLSWDNQKISLKESYQKSDSAFNQYLTNKIGATKSLHIAKNGKEMYSSDEFGRIIKWNIESRQQTVLYQNSKIHKLVTFSVDESWIAISTNEDQIGLFDLTAPQKGIKMIKSHDGAIVDIDFFSDGSGYVTVGTDRKVFQHDFKKSKLITEIEFSANSLDISPDKKTIAIGSQRGDIGLIDLTQDENNIFNIYRDKLDSKPVEVVQFSEDGRFLAFGGYDRDTELGYVHIWDNVSKEAHGPRLIGFTSGITDICFSDNGEMIAISCRDNTARVWQMDDNSIYNFPATLDDHGDWVWSIDFHPDSKRLFTASGDGIIRVFNLDLSNFDDAFCPKATRNLTPLEWKAFIGKEEDFPWEPTCPNLNK
jgi:hypothetical protein